MGQNYRLKQYIAHIFKQVEGCLHVLVVVSQSMKLLMIDASKEKVQPKKPKRTTFELFKWRNCYDIDKVDSRWWKWGSWWGWFWKKTIEISSKRKLLNFFKKVDKSMVKVVVSCSLLVQRLNVDRYIISM